MTVTIALLLVSFVLDGAILYALLWRGRRPAAPRRRKSRRKTGLRR